MKIFNSLQLLDALVIKAVCCCHLLPFEPDSVRGGGLEAHVVRQVLHQGSAPRERDH